MSSNEASSTDNFSLSDNVRSFIQQAYDNKIDLTVKSNREDMVKQFKEHFPKENPKTITTLFSKETPKISKAYGINPDDVKREPAKKFTKSNEIKTQPQEKKSGLKIVGMQNPALVDKNGKPIVVGTTGQTPVYKYEIKSSQISAFGNAALGLMQLFSEDLEDFTPSESDDIGDLWQPVAQAKLGNSDKGQTMLAVGGTFGILARKAKTAKANRKVRKEKEAQERGTEIEPDRIPKTEKDSKE